MEGRGGVGRGRRNGPYNAYFCHEMLCKIWALKKGIFYKGLEIDPDRMSKY